MPLYEYECETCSEVFFELRRSDDREKPIECPTCGGPGRVLISQVATGKGSTGGCSSDTHFGGG
jgi:putative FmdB family regulatory protein